MTFTIIGIDKKSGELGIACFSKAFTVGAIVPAVDLRVGAVATQSYPNVLYKEQGMKLLKKYSPEKTVSMLINSDKGKDKRQVLVMNKRGLSAAFTGKNNVFWAGSLRGKNCICAGNMLVGEQVLIEMVKYFEQSNKCLSEKLVDSLRAGEKCGGDKRRKMYNSASLIVEKNGGGIFGFGNRYVDIRVDYDRNSIKRLSKLLRIRLQFTPRLFKTRMKGKNKIKK